MDDYVEPISETLKPIPFLRGLAADKSDIEADSFAFCADWIEWLEILNTQRISRIEQLEAALQTLCYHWDQMLNNLDDGEEFEAREAARAALGQEKAE